jgi:hypothetical protein
MLYFLICNDLFLDLLYSNNILYFLKHILYFLKNILYFLKHILYFFKAYSLFFKVLPVVFFYYGVRRTTYRRKHLNVLYPYGSWYSPRTTISCMCSWYKYLYLYRYVIFWDYGTCTSNDFVLFSTRYLATTCTYHDLREYHMPGPIVVSYGTCTTVLLSSRPVVYFSEK